MQKNIVKKIYESYKNKSLFHKIFCYFLIKAGYSNYNIQALEIRNKTFLYLKKRYGKFVKKIKYNNSLYKTQTKVVWVCWIQGIDRAPVLVQRCIESMKKNIYDWELRIVTSDNLFDYISLPDYILEKWRKGIISNTCFADMIRNELLIRHGGLWLDATVFVTGKIPEYITDRSFFVYNHSNYDDTTISYNNWLILSEKGNPILKHIQELMFKYWKKENALREYFLWHLFATLIKEKNEEIFADINDMTDELPETLARVYYKEYDENYWNMLKNTTSIHKLSNKFDVSKCGDKSYYNRLILGLLI